METDGLFIDDGMTRKGLINLASIQASGLKGTLSFEYRPVAQAAHTQYRVSQESRSAEDRVSGSVKLVQQHLVSWDARRRTRPGTEPSAVPIREEVIRQLNPWVIDRIIAILMEYIESDAPAADLKNSTGGSGS